MRGALGNEVAAVARDFTVSDRHWPAFAALSGFARTMSDQRDNESAPVAAKAEEPSPQQDEQNGSHGAEGSRVEGSPASRDVSKHDKPEEGREREDRDVEGAQTRHDEGRKQSARSRGNRRRRRSRSRSRDRREQRHRSKTRSRSRSRSRRHRGRSREGRSQRHRDSRKDRRRKSRHSGDHGKKKRRKKCVRGSVGPRGARQAPPVAEPCSPAAPAAPQAPPARPQLGIGLGLGRIGQ